MAPGVFRLPDQRIRVRAEKRGYGKVESTFTVSYLDDGRTRLTAARKLPDGRLDIVLPRNANLRTELLKIREGFMDSLRPTGGAGGSLTARTFGDALTIYRDRPKRSGERRKMIGSQSRFDWLMDNFGKVPIREINGALWRFRTKAEAGKLEWSTATVNRILAMAKAATSAAYNARDSFGERMLDTNLLEGFPLLPEHNIRYRILDNEERRRFWKHCPPEYRPLWYYASRTPARVSELINLTRADVNHLGGMFAHLSGERTKGRFSRNLVLWPEFQDYVKSYLDSPAEYFFNSGPPNYAPLGFWSKERGKRMLHSGWVHEVCEAAGIEGYNFHKTRQEAAMHLYQEGWSRQEIMLVGGWKSEAAFDRYFNPELAALIDKGIAQLDTGWYKSFAEELRGFWSLQKVA